MYNPNPNPRKPAPGATLTRAALDLYDTMMTPGRHGVRIFGLPPNQMAMACTAAMLFAFPSAVIVGMVPLWDRIGDLALVQQLNGYVAPAIDSLTYDDRASALPGFPLKRFLVASSSLIELIFLSNFIALFARGVRKHALLVWTCYDRRKIFRYLCISGLLFGGLWFVFFVDWRFFAFVNFGGRGTQLDAYLIMAMPFVAVVFGHMAAIVGLGVWRTVSRSF